MKKLTTDYKENVALLDRILRVRENFDVLKKILMVGEDEITLYYIDGFIKDTVMQKMMLSISALKGLGKKSEDSASSFISG